MYGVMTTACFHRYSWKELLAQHPFAFITLKGTPQRRYLRVEPMQMP